MHRWLWTVSRVLAVCALLAACVTPAEAQERGGQLTASVSAYCHEGMMRTGLWTRSGAVAVDPSVIPLYSSLTIEGLPGTYQALDTGGGIVGNMVDVYMPDCERALEWGRRTRVVDWWSEG